MGIKIDEYLSSLGAVSDISLSTVQTVQANTKAEEAEYDSYVSTVIDSDAAIPCENYNDILQVIRNNKAEQEGSATTSQQETGGGISGAVGSGGGSSSEDEEETTTKMVVINGITYMETTTTTNEITTVTRVPMGGTDIEENSSNFQDEEIKKVE